MNNYYFIIFFTLIGIGRSLSQSNDNIYVKHFTKNNKIVIRILPKNRAVYNEITNKALEVTRYENNAGVLTNSVIIEDLLRSYHLADTLNWMRLFRKDKNKAGFIYNMLYPNNSSEKISLEERTKLEKTAFDMMLLSCDLDREIAKACGLYLADTSINNSKKYVYKISIYTSSLSAITNQLYTMNIDASQLSMNKSITDLKGKSRNRTCELNWKAYDYNSDYSGYNIYRSIDNVTFKKVNASPVILLSTQFEKNKHFIHYSDTMPEPNRKYYYYVKGINFFGEEGNASNVFTAASITEVNSIPLIDTIKVIENRSIRVKWRMENNNETPLPEKYILMRSNKDNGTYKTIYEGKDDLLFIDRSPETLNFYKVGAILRNNDTLFSYSRFANIIDTIPPTSPKGLKAKVDKNGIVTICWNKNKEADLQGYKLFQSNRLQDEFVQMNNKFITDTLTTDKLNLKNLSKRIYYKLAASDNNFNTSILSEPIEVKRPDTIPPQAPILVSAIQQTNGIAISYILSKSSDVSKQTLLRKSNSDNDFKNLLTFHENDSIGNVLDTLTEPGQHYFYKLIATDEDSNSCYSRVLNVLFETGFRKKITDISFSVDRTAKKIDLNWKYDVKEIEKFIIYRSKKDEKPTIIKTLDGNKARFTDKTANIGNIYEYRIKAAFVNGAESVISSPIIVEY